MLVIISPTFTLSPCRVTVATEGRATIYCSSFSREYTRPRLIKFQNYNHWRIFYFSSRSRILYRRSNSKAR